MPINIAMGVLFVMVLLRLIVHIVPSLLSSFSKLQRSRWLEGWDSVVGALLGALLLVKFVVRPFYIPSGSMEPTLLVNDRILVNSFLYDITNPNRGDVVVFFPPPEQATEEGIILIKRVVALAHDRWQVKDGKLFLNDIPLAEPFIKERIVGEWGPETVKEGHILVMGDNRNNSRDSRFIGQIPIKNVLGRAECIFYPFNRLTLFNFPHPDEGGFAQPIATPTQAPSAIVE